MSIYKQAEKFELENLEAAHLVLADPDRYGGEPAALTIWARAIVRHDRERTGQDAEGLLFANQTGGAA